MFENYKTPCQKRRTAHAIKRFKERYGREITIEQYDALCDVIICCKSIKHWKQSKTKVLHLLKIGKEYIVAVYSKSTKKIITFLPLECVYDKLFLELMGK